MRNDAPFETTTIRWRALVALLIVTAIAGIGGSSARATGSTLCVSTVANGGNDATATRGGTCYATLQGALGAAQAGDTIQIGAGQFDEAGHVVIQDTSNLTIVGNGQTGAGATTINTNVPCGCSASHTYGVLIQRSHDITLQNLTVIGPSALNSGAPTVNHGTGYGLHDDGDTNIALVDVTVRDSARSNLDFNGTTGITLTNVTATGAAWGNGVNLTDTNNVTIDGITTSGNAWGGIALYATGTYYPCGVHGVSVANANLGEQSALYTGIDKLNNAACVVTGLSVDGSELPYRVSMATGDSSNSSDPQTIYTTSLANANAVIAASSPRSPSLHAATDSVASLSALSVSAGSLSPSFSPSTTSYSATVDNGTTNVAVSATAAYGGAAVVSGGSSLAVGANTATVTVTSADTTATTTYTITVTRADAPPPPTTTATTTAPAPTPAATTTTATTPTTTSVTAPQPTQAATVVANQPQSAAAPLGKSGSVDVVVSTTPQTAAGGTEGPATPAPVSVGLSWPSTAFSVPVTVSLTPQPLAAVPAGETPPTPVAVAGGFSVGNTVVQVNVTTDAGVAVTQFAAPLQIHMSSLPAGQAPAYSHDGKTWTFIPALASPVLPAGQQDGYFVNPDGSIDIYTRHATLFGLLMDTQAPSRPTVTAHVVGDKLSLLVRAKDNGRVASYRVLVNGKVTKRTTHAYLVVPARAGRVQLVAVDAAGNVSAASKPVVVRRTTTTSRPYRIVA